MNGSRFHSRRTLTCLVAIAAFLTMAKFAFPQTGRTDDENKSVRVGSNDSSKEKKLETATLGGGCFWCVEAVYQRINGVTKVVSGYSGGQVENPTYEAVCTGRTGHAEVCQITFDSSIISFEEMLLYFFNSHDPTTLNKQGQDVGTQYRSVVFYEDDAQRESTEKVIAELTADKEFGSKKIVTEISPLPDFYPAEDYHQNYFKLHPRAAYCQHTIVPKIKKLEKFLKEMKLKKERKEKEEKKGTSR